VCPRGRPKDAILPGYLGASEGHTPGQWRTRSATPGAWDSHFINRDDVGSKKNPDLSNRSMPRNRDVRESRIRSQLGVAEFPRHFRQPEGGLENARTRQTVAHPAAKPIWQVRPSLRPASIGARFFQRWGVATDSSNSLASSSTGSLRETSIHSHAESRNRVRYLNAMSTSG